VTFCGCRRERCSSWILSFIFLLASLALLDISVLTAPLITATYWMKKFREIGENLRIVEKKKLSTYGSPKRPGPTTQYRIVPGVNLNIWHFEIGKSWVPRYRYISLRLKVEVFQFLCPTSKFVAVLRLMVNPLRTLS